MFFPRLLKKLTTKKTLAILTIALLAASAGSLPAFGAPGVAKVISYQGRLTDSTGVNAPDGAYSMKLQIYDAVSGGSCVWSAANTDANVATTDCGAPGAITVTVTGGLFSVLLGDTAAGQNTLPATVYTDDARWLGVTVNADAEMIPRRRLAVAYQALNSLTLNSLSTSAVGGANAFVPVTDAAGNLTLTQNITAGTGVIVGNTTLAGSSVSSTGALNIAAGGGDDLVLTSGTDTARLGVGTNEITNTDVGANLVLSAEGDIKIKDGDTLILGSLPADPVGGTNGAAYYNTVSNVRRCFEGGVWANCNANAFKSQSGVTSLVNANDQVGIGTNAPVAGTKLQVVSDDAINNDITNILTFDHTTSGTAANGIGIGTDYRVENNVGTTTDAGHLNAFFTNVTSGAEASAFSFETRTAGGPVAERFRITAAGVAPALTNNTEDVGGAGNQWRSGYLGTNLIINANTTLSDGSLATSSGDLNLQPAGASTIAKVQIGAGGVVGSTTPDFLVVDSSSNGFGTGNPAGGANGAIYYNIASSKFRCFEGGAWKDCDTSGNTSLQSAYGIGNSITTALTTPILFTLTSGNFNVTGAGAVNFTPTSSSQFTSAGSLTLTGGTASTWSTLAGDLSLGSGSGILKLAASTNTLSNTDATTNLILKATGGIKIDNTNTLIMASQAADPAGVNGATYYNTGTNKFRCFINGSWSDCDTTGGASSLQTSYNNGATIITGSGTPILFTLTSGNFNATGTGSVNLTPTAASQFTSGGALTLTAGAASTWSTTSGNLTLLANGAGTGNVQIGSGAGTTTPDLLVADIKTDAGDPSGTNGAMYYNANSNTFRCFTNSTWVNCDTTGGSPTLQSSYNGGATITTSGATNIAFTLASGNFNVTGAGSVNLTPTSASQFTSGGALTLTAGAGSTWSTTSGALTLTSAAAASWGTSAGNLNLYAAGSNAGSVIIGSGTPSATPDLFVFDNKSTTGDPTGTNGAMYYNNADNMLRCYVNGAWQDCPGTWTAIANVNQMKVPNQQLQVGTTAVPAGVKADISLDDASNNASSTILVLDHTTTGTAGNGIGSNLLFRDENDIGGVVNAGEISAVLDNVANGTEDSSLRFLTQGGGSGLVEHLRITSAGNLVPGSSNNSLDVGAAGNVWRTLRLGTSVIIGGTTLSDGTLGSTGALNLTSGSGSAVTVSSSSGTLLLAAGTNQLHNTDASTDIIVHATRNLKIDDTSLLALSVKAADPAAPPSTNGTIYYNSGTNKFRCYQNSAWIDCVTGGTVTGTGTNGQVSFWTGSSTQSGDDNLFWDNTAKALGIGTNTIHAGVKLEVEQSDATTNAISNVSAFEHNTTGTAVNGIGAGILLRSQNDSGTEFSAARVSGVMTNVATGSEAGALVFDTYGAGALTERARITSTGSLTFAQASAVSTSTGALTVDSAAALNLGTAAATSVSLGRTGVTTTNNGALTVTQTLTASNGFTLSGGALNLTATSGALTISGLGASSISTGGNALTITSSNFNTTATGINSTAIGTTTAAAGKFTTLTSTGATDLANAGASNVTIATTGTGTVAIGNATGTFALTSSGGLNVTTAGALTGVASIDTISFSATAITAAGALTIDSGTTNALNFGNGGNAKTITIGNNTTTTALNITSGTGAQTFTSSNATGVTTASSFVFNDAALTSGTLLRLNSTSTSGKIIDLNMTNTTGTVFNNAYGASTTQGGGALIAEEWDMNTNLTAPAAGQNVTAIDMKLPTASTTSNAAVYTGLNLSTAGSITNATAGSFNWRGANITMPNITQSAGGTVHADGLLVTTGSITTAGTIDGMDVTATGVGAGSLNGISISSITGGAGTEYAINIGAGWDAGIDFDDTTSVIRLGATDDTGVLKIVDSAATPNSLFEVRDMSTNFGAASTSGAFISRNSYFGEEFNAFHANTTATTAVIRGDNGVSGELSFSGVTAGAGGTTTAASQNTTNGVERLTPVSGAANGRTAATLEYLGTTVAGTANNIYLAANLPVVTVKIMPTVVGANNRVFAGISDAAAAVTTMPVNGIFFSNCTASATCGTNWNGVVNVAGTVTTVSCGAVDTAHFAYGRIEVRSTTDVHFFMDTNTSDGVTETECGTGLTTTPTVAMTVTMEAASLSTGAATNTTNFDIDYFRSWQDDNASIATAMAAVMAPTDETPAPTVDQIQAEGPTDPIAIIAAKLSADWQSVTDFVGARVTAIRGYFDEVFANKTHQKTLCVGDAASGNETCITKDQLDQIISNQNSSNQQTLNAPSAPPAFVPPPTTPDANVNVPATPAPNPAANDQAPATDTNTPTTADQVPANDNTPSMPTTVEQPPADAPASAPASVDTAPAPAAATDSPPAPQAPVELNSTPVETVTP